MVGLQAPAAAIPIKGVIQGLGTGSGELRQAALAVIGGLRGPRVEVFTRQEGGEWLTIGKPLPGSEDRCLAAQHGPEAMGFPIEI